MEEEDPEYDLEERTFQFALQIRLCIAKHKWTPDQWTDIKQVLRSSGSVAENYTEANNAFSKADFSHRIGICKKESGESKLWLRLLGSPALRPKPNPTYASISKKPTNSSASSQKSTAPRNRIPISTHFRFGIGQLIIGNSARHVTRPLT